MFKYLSLNSSSYSSTIRVKVYFRLFRPSTKEYSDKWVFYYGRDDSQQFRLLFGEQALRESRLFRQLTAKQTKLAAVVKGKTEKNNDNDDDDNEDDEDEKLLDAIIKFTSNSDSRSGDVEQNCELLNAVIRNGTHKQVNLFFSSTFNLYHKAS